MAATLERSFDPVGSDASAGSLYSLYEASENRRSGPDGLPLPPVHLVRITSGCARQARTSLDRMYRSFYEGGAQGAGWIRDMVARAGADVARMDAILDFGSGAGRVIRHWRGLERPQLHGSDYNPYLSGWCADNLPFARFAVNELEPPLPYGDGQFDLVYSISIFTHLDEDLQRPWIEELARIVRPGGLVLVTVSGEQRAADHLPAPDRERFERGELVVKRSVLSGMNACAAYHPAAYIREALARGFELVEHAPNGAPDVRQDACCSACRSDLGAAWTAFEEVFEQPVEERRPLDHRHVAGLLEDHPARVRDQPLVPVGAAHRHDPVVAPPDDQRRVARSPAAGR